MPNDPTGVWPAGYEKELCRADTVLRSTANTLTLGGANSLAAGLDALLPVRGQGFRERYAANVAAERARDQYDVAHRPVAQQIGAGAATALSLSGPGGLATPVRIAGAAARTGLETAARLGIGGASGLAFQDLSDAAAHRPGDWRDSVGAVAGGVLGAAASPLGAGRAAAIGSAATTAAQDLLHGRPVSLNAVGQSAVSGRLIGSAAGLAGHRWSQSLSSQAKGDLGERLGAVRSAINRMEREPGPKKLFKPKGWKAGTYPDGRSGDKLFEDKFGPTAKLSDGQLMAQSTLGPNYIVSHLLPEDVGKIFGLPLTGLAPQLADRQPAGYPARTRRGR